MSKHMVASGNTAVVEVQFDSHGSAVAAHEEAGPPPPIGAVCKSCFSSELVQSRRPGIYAAAKWFGYKVYRCRQCMRRTIW